MIISIYIKNGTGGYNNHDGCDYLVKKIESTSFMVPRIHESINILEPNDSGLINPNDGNIAKTFHQYLVTDVHYNIVDDADYECDVRIYVVPIGRRVLSN